MYCFGHPDSVVSIAFSHNGKWLATGGADGIARIFQIGTGQRLSHTEYKGTWESVDSISFSPDGRWLATADGEAARIWPIHPEDLIAEACSRLTRNLTREEWRQYMGDEPYRCTCENLPPAPEETPTP